MVQTLSHVMFEDMLALCLNIFSQMIFIAILGDYWQPGVFNNLYIITYVVYFEAIQNFPNY